MESYSAVLMRGLKPNMETVLGHQIHVQAHPQGAVTGTSHIQFDLKQVHGDTKFYRNPYQGAGQYKPKRRPYKKDCGRHQYPTVPSTMMPQIDFQTAYNQPPPYGQAIFNGCQMHGLPQQPQPHLQLHVPPQPQAQEQQHNADATADIQSPYTYDMASVMSNLMARNYESIPTKPQSKRSRGKGSNYSPSSLYKTELCRSFEQFGACRYGLTCQFAHGFVELREIERHPKYKTRYCYTFHSNGFCPYGTRCHFIHDIEEKMAHERIQRYHKRQLMNA